MVPRASAGVVHRCWTGLRASLIFRGRVKCLGLDEIRPNQRGPREPVTDYHQGGQLALGIDWAGVSGTSAATSKPLPHEVPTPAPKAPNQNPVQYLLHCLDKGVPLEGPVSLPISRIGQEIVDAAVKSAKLKRAVKLAA